MVPGAIYGHLSHASAQDSILPFSLKLSQRMDSQIAEWEAPPSLLKAYKFQGRLGGYSLGSFKNFSKPSLMLPSLITLPGGLCRIVLFYILWSIFLYIILNIFWLIPEPSSFIAYKLPESRDPTCSIYYSTHVLENIPT